ncbi:hypothetical protein C5Y96_09875 [Blastopirellula marina]|uniref:Uncharacterized protein n=2 Tax=Pirellulales TaxID=2691354 RepID=A0A2S8FLU4_9BACT|nr:hypothetical protein C5Y96_09875 [Blastopirellula marina]RCS52247.1 hypothetical protein DTL36_09885 [Bremerella cremea]
MTLNRTWIAECSNHDDPVIVESAWVDETGLQWGDAYVTESSSYSFAVINGIDYSFVDESTWIWLINVTYGKREKFRNPLLEPARLSFGLYQTQIPVDFDCFGRAILNPCGEPYEEPVMRDDSRSTLTVRLNVGYNSFNWGVAQQYRDCTNSNWWKGGAPGTVKISDISAESDEHDEIGAYWKVAYTFHHNPLTWDSRPLNKGFHQLVDGKPKKILLADGKEPDTAQLLDNNGKFIPKGTGQPTFGRFQIYNRVPFNFPF